VHRQTQVVLELMKLLMLEAILQLVLNAKASPKENQFTTLLNQGMAAMMLGLIHVTLTET